jgi:hypothetical protein
MTTCFFSGYPGFGAITTSPFLCPEEGSNKFLQKHFKLNETRGMNLNSIDVYSFELQKVTQVVLYVRVKA